MLLDYVLKVEQGLGLLDGNSRMCRSRYVSKVFGKMILELNDEVLNSVVNSQSSPVQSIGLARTGLD